MTIVEARVPTRAPGLELLGQQQDSGYQDAPSTVRRADGQSVQVTPLLYALLEVIDGGRDLDQLADALSQRTGKSVSAENVRVLIEEKLEPLGLVCGPDGAPPAERTPTPLLALKWKVVVTDPAITRRVTAPFAALFHKAIVQSGSGLGAFTTEQAARVTRAAAEVLGIEPRVEQFAGLLGPRGKRPARGENGET